MKKIFIIIFLVTSLWSLDFKSMSGDYDVRYGIFGKVGVAKTSLEIKDGRYHVKMVAKATGFAKFLSQGKVETYESRGYIKNDLLIPEIFTKVRKNDHKFEKKEYVFDHKDKKVTVYATKIKDHKSKKSKSELDYYAKDDLLSLFFNLKILLGNRLKTDGAIKLYAVGANKKDGRVDIYTPKNRELKSIKKLLKEDENIFVAIINQKIFSSNRGELYLNLNDDGICTKALLKDVIFFGDIRGKLTNLKVD